MKFAAAEVLGGTGMGGCGKTSAGKILDGAGETTSSLNGDSIYTHHVTRKGGFRCVGGPMARILRWRAEEDLDPKGNPSVDW